MGANVFIRLPPQRDLARIFLQVKGSPARLSPTVTDTLEFPDTEKVTASNPVRPTRHFLFLARPGSALWPYNWPCPLAMSGRHS